MKQLNKCVLFFIVLFLNTTYLFADIGNRGRWDNGGTSNFGMSLWVLLGIIAGGFFACIFIKNGLENGFKDICFFGRRQGFKAQQAAHRQAKRPSL